MGLSLFFRLLVFTFVVTQVVDSVKIVSINKNEEPPSVSTMDPITKIMIRMIPILLFKRLAFIQYYAPEWCDKKNSHVYFASTMSRGNKDRERLKNKPKNILISSEALEGINIKIDSESWLYLKKQIRRNRLQLAGFV